MTRAAIIVIMLLFGLTAGGWADDLEIKVRTAGGTEKIEGVEFGETVYLNLCEVSDILGGQVTWKKAGLTAAFTIDNHSFRFTVGSPYLNLDGVVTNLILPAKIIRGALFVPAETFTPMLDKVRQENIVWDGATRMLRIETEWFTITDLAVSPKENGTLIDIYTNGQVKYEIYQTEGNWLNIEFPEGKINRSKIMASAGPGVLKVKAFQFETSAQLAIQLPKSFAKFRQTYRTDPDRLQIAIEDETYVPDSTAVSLNRIGPDEKIDVIVIDAGHGGNEFGAIGRRSKTREKEITLEIARELARLLRQEKNFKVVMTRSKDESVPLATRAKIANDAKADLFISIHCNASPKTAAHGFQVFYLAPAKNDSARAVAQSENAPFLIDDPTLKTDDQGDLAIILNDMIQTEFLAESADLAYMTDMELRRNLSLSDRGVDHAGFVVLNRVFMPSILVESAFISNTEEEKLLRDKSFRQKVARSLFDAVKRFQAKYERKQ